MGKGVTQLCCQTRVKKGKNKSPVWRRGFYRKEVSCIERLILVHEMGIYTLESMCVGKCVHVVLHNAKRKK
nr:MAG TPA: hypothetical protein [Caudoviricetes sp.]